MPSQELPITAPVDPKKLDKCTRYLLFTDQYVSAADYPDAEDTLKEAKKYCSPDDPRLNYMEAILADNNEEKEKAYRLYYKAALGYIKEGKMEQAFKCYSGMISINPEGKEVKELKRYFEDEDY
jgi:tetratricopeptide (TPR) repeat protein